jgi:hypothetical protein
MMRRMLDDGGANGVDGVSADEKKRAKVSEVC